MEIAGCILLLLQLFLSLLSTYTNLLHLLSLNQTLSCFFQLIPSILSMVGPVYIFHPFYVAWLSSKHFHQFISKHEHTPHTICPCQLICCFLQSQHVHQLHCIPFVHQLYTAHCPHSRFFCSSQNSYFISLKYHILLPYNIADLT